MVLDSVHVNKLVKLRLTVRTDLTMLSGADTVFCSLYTARKNYRKVDIFFLNVSVEKGFF